MNFTSRQSKPIGDQFTPDRLRQEAGRCVACGLCLPHCPTYRKTFSEADSPRGRIFMIAAVLEGKLDLSADLAGHLDLCLTCRACEAVCPSQVRYGELIDGVRSDIGTWRGRPLHRRIALRTLLDIFASPRLLRGAGRMLWIYQRSGLRSLLRKTGLLRHMKLERADARLPTIAFAAPSFGIHHAECLSNGTVGLFLGCIARMSDVEVLNAAVFLITRLGYDVHVMPDQVCCGALHRHQGDSTRAAHLAQQNRKAFSHPDLLAIVHASSGCGATLAEYAPPLDLPVLDISTFLVNANGWERLKPAPLSATIAVHEPCSGRNVLRDQGAVYALLQRIPGARVVALPGNDQCCGAAGIYALTQPEMAEALLRDKISAIRTGDANIVASSNPGCAMHVAAGLRAEGLGVEVTHPAVLVARQLGFPND